MSVIHAQRPLATGIDTAVQALKKAQDRLGVAAATVARSGAAISASSGTKEGARVTSPAQTPPNPGPPGGAVPGDLAQAMMAQNGPTQAAEPDLLDAMVGQLTAGHEFSANVKTVQAFDAMLEELTRLKQPK